MAKTRTMMAREARAARAEIEKGVGVSDKSWSDAAQQAVERASETIQHITGLDVIHSTAVVRDRKIVEYHVNVKIAFVVEGALIQA